MEEKNHKNYGKVDFEDHEIEETEERYDWNIEGMIGINH